MNRLTKLLLSSLTLLVLSACGGGGDGATANTAPVNTDCVLGTSKIGDCTL